MKDPDFADPVFQAQMAALGRQYRDGLPLRHAALAEAWSQCADDGEEAAWLRLREVAHKLSGSAASYGFDAMGAAARDLDRLLSGRPPCRRRATAEPAVARVRSALDAVIGAD